MGLNPQTQNTKKKGACVFWGTSIVEKCIGLGMAGVAIFMTKRFYDEEKQ